MLGTMDYTGSENRAPFSFSLNTALQSILTVLTHAKKSIKLILEDKSFQFAAPRLWNALPSEVRSISVAYDLFKGANLDVIVQERICL